MMKFLRNKILCGALVLGAFVLPSLASATIEISDGSVKALWHLNDTADSSGNGLTLTNSGTTFIPGKFATSSQIGTTWQNTNALYIASDAAVDLNGASAVSFWFFPTATSSGSVRPFYWYSNTGTGRAIQVTWDPGHVTDKLDIEWGGGDHFTNTGISTSVWHNMTLTSDGTLVRVYLDGTQLQQFARGSAANSTVKIGLGNNSGQTAGLRGQMDDVALFNKDLTTSTIIEIWNSGNGNEICVTVGCTATSTPPATTSATSTDAAANSQYQVIILLVIASLLFFDLMRRMFAGKFGKKLPFA